MGTHGTRDKDKTTQAVLNTAEELFAERGFNGVSIKAISQKSGVSGPLILFHFQSKKELYHQVKAAIVKRYGNGSPPHPIFRGSLRKFLEEIIHSMFRMYRENPTMIRMANWGHLEGELENWPGEEEWHHVWIEDIERAQAQGMIRKDIQPYDILVMISGTIHVWWEYHEHFLLDKRLVNNPQQADKSYAVQLVKVLERGLAPLKP